MTRKSALKHARRFLGLKPDQFRVRALRRHQRCQIEVTARPARPAHPWEPPLRHVPASAHTWALALRQLGARYSDASSRIIVPPRPRIVVP